MPQGELEATGGTGGGPAAQPAAGTGAAGDPPEIAAAIRRAQAGDDEAFEAILLRFGPPLKQFLLNHGLPEAVAQDLYQETVLQAWRQIDRYRFEGPFAAWLQRIGENLWKNDRRAWETQKRKMALVSLEAERAAGPLERDEPFFGAPPASPEAHAVAADGIHRVEAALAELPDGQRRCIELLYFQELKYREVAELLGVKTGTVQSQVHDGMNRLRDLLAAGAGGGER